jgi:general stress protein YciG
MTKINEIEVTNSTTPQMISALDFLDQLEKETKTTKTKTKRTKKSEGLDYHVKAGRIGGQTTKQRHRDSNFYKEIGAKGGTTTMARHGEEYDERRKKGGETTRERYGEEYYHEIAAKAARVKQEATMLRNEAIKALMQSGLKIPTIIKLKPQDLEHNPNLAFHLNEGAVAEYLKERAPTDNELLFVSQSGKPLSLANTYTIMERHRP